MNIKREREWNIPIRLIKEIVYSVIRNKSQNENS